MADKKSLLMDIMGPKDGDDGEDGASDGDGTLKACAEELIDCVHSKDADGVVSAFKAMFQELEMEPHEEAEHEE